MYTIKNIETNTYIGAIMINNILLFHKKPTVVASKTTMEKLLEKIYIKCPTLKDKLMIVGAE